MYVYLQQLSGRCLKLHDQTASGTDVFYIYIIAFNVSHTIVILAVFPNTHLLFRTYNQLKNIYIYLALFAGQSQTYRLINLHDSPLAVMICTVLTNYTLQTHYVIINVSLFQIM